MSSMKRANNIVQTIAIKCDLGNNGAKEKVTNVTLENLVGMAEKNQHFYEWLEHNKIYKPYFDYETLHKSEKEMDSAMESEFKNAFDIIQSRYVKGRVFGFDSSGFCSKHKSWKVSFRFIVKGAGAYDQRLLDVHAREMKAKFNGFDTGVYNNGRCMRMPYASKSSDPERQFQRFHEGELLSLVQLENLSENYQDYIIQWTDAEAQHKWIEPKQEEKKEVNKEEKKVVTVEKDLDLKYEYVESLVSCLNVMRANDRQTWIVVMWCLKNLADRSGLDLEPLAHNFSKLCADKYSASAVSNTFKDTDSLREVKLGIPALRGWAQTDNPQKYEEMHMIKDIKETYYNSEGLLALNAMKSAITDIERWMCGCLIQVVNGGSSLWFARAGPKTYTLLKDPFKGSDDIEIYKNKEKRTKVTARSIFMELKGKKEFIKHCCYNEVDFIPTWNMERTNVFNLFTGFPLQPSDAIVPAEIFNHMKVLAPSPEAFEYMVNWMAHLVQQPADKVGTCMVFKGKQGTGKNIFWEWFGEQIMGPWFLPVNDLDALCGKFNKRMEAKLFCILDEIGNYGGGFKSNDKLKSILTGKVMTIEPKGKEAYTIHDYCRYVMFTNNDWPVKVEQSDRRYVILDVNEEKLGNTDYFQTLLSKLTKQNAAAFLGWLLKKDISKWDRSKLPVTDARKEMMMASIASPVRWLIEDLRDSEEKEFAASSEEMYKSYYEWMQKSGEQSRMSHREFTLTITKKLGFKTTQFTIEREFPDGKPVSERKRGIKMQIDLMKATIAKYVKDDKLFA